jgi:hypothetical protein
MSRNRDFGKAAESLAAPSSSYNGYAHIADSTQASGWNYSPLSRNFAINGAFDSWQRGTSFSQPAGGYTADRFAFAQNAAVTYTISRQSFTDGDIPSAAASVGSQYYLQNATTVVPAAGITDWYHRIEDVSMFSGKQVTISYYARATIGTAQIQVVVSQYNGSTYVDTPIQEYPTFVAGNGWRRYSVTVTLPTIARSGITGPYHHTNFILRNFHSVTTFGIWGFQIELGPVATPFTRAGGSIGQEIDLCKRYYYRLGGKQTQTRIVMGSASSSTAAFWIGSFPVEMRVAPSGSIVGSPIWYDKVGGGTFTTYSMASTSPETFELVGTGGTGLTLGRAVGLTFDSQSVYLEFNSEIWS